MDLYITLGLIAFLLLLSGLFSCAETVFTHVKLERLSHLKQQKSLFADLALNLLSNREALITTILIGNNLANIFASALATSLTIAYFGEIGVFIAAAIMTIVIVLFMEIYPKVYALRHPESLSLVLAPLVRLSMLLFFPLTKISQFIIHQGGPTVNSGDMIVPLSEEIKHLIESRKQPDLRKEEQDMLEAIFELREVKIEDVMVHRSEIEALDINQTKSELLQQIFTSKHSMLPVWEQELDNIIGVISKKSVLQLIGRAEDNDQLIETNIDWRELLRKPWFVPETTSLMVQLQAFIKQKNYFSLVVDEYGTLMGIVTLGDILEEIVGELVDEDTKENLISKDSQGTALVLGRAAVRDVNRQLDWDLPEEEVTIAGIILNLTHAIPQKNTAVTVPGYRLTVIESKRSKINQVLIEKI